MEKRDVKRWQSKHRNEKMTYSLNETKTQTEKERMKKDMQIKREKHSIQL